MSWLLASAISVIMGKGKKFEKADEGFSALAFQSFLFSLFPFPSAKPPREVRLGTVPWGKASWGFQWRHSPRDGRRFLRSTGSGWESARTSGGCDVCGQG
jgi:hypothetical protein